MHSEPEATTAKQKYTVLHTARVAQATKRTQFGQVERQHLENQRSRTQIYRESH